MAKILVVDDDQAICGLLQFVLKNAGHEVFIAHDGDAGVQLYFRERPKIVLTDLFMPNKNGFDAVVRLSQLVDPPTVFVMTGWTEDAAFGNEDNSKLAVDLGARELFRKPLDIAHLLRSIAQAAGKPEPVAAH